MEITVDYERPAADLPHFWRSTGFTPGKLLLDPDTEQAMAYVGSVPNDGVEYVRIHYLLDLVRATGFESGDPSYDWTDLDRAIDTLVHNGLRPFFELMGYPSTGAYFDDFHDPEQTRAWKGFVADLAEHLIGRYGREEVRRWAFETWNEPDIPGHWDRWGFARDHEAFCRYYDACRAGLAAVDPELRMGGPGTARTLSPLLRAFLAHCADGENCLTGEPVGIDFLSVHEKGASPNDEDVTPDTAGILDRELQAYDYVADTHPELADVPVMNNECDPHTGWTDTHTWRAKPYYAAVVARIVDQHVEGLLEGSAYDYELLSNDNGFIGTWGQRTHLTRFGEGGFGGRSLDPNRALERERVDAFAFVRKPVHNVMTALSLLGDERLRTDADPEGLHVLPTRRDGGDRPTQVAVLLANATDAVDASGSTSVDLRVRNLPVREAAVAHYRIDRDHGNPFATWEAQGAPEEPSPEQLAELRRSDRLATLEATRTLAVEDGALTLDFELPLPGVSLVHVVGKPDGAPATVEGVRAETYRGLHAADDVLISWEDLATRAIRGYEVLRADSADGPFEQVNAAAGLTSAHVHARPAAAEPGRYAVRAVDHWGRRGERSEAVTPTAR